ncbi:hypothetical protein GMA8713_05246 [Grimontia marina]|uniref:Uncharacterized protein n=1 Tax=Grimontia marina TaxID=646534 RepID=A0A128FLT5_9GAMM|nr:hypothetical protein GMA8713_05246 [Grimontia marina]
MAVLTTDCALPSCSSAVEHDRVPAAPPIPLGVSSFLLTISSPFSPLSLPPPSPPLFPFLYPSFPLLYHNFSNKLLIRNTAILLHP